jgi:hypothetical protein
MSLLVQSARPVLSGVRVGTQLFLVNATALGVLAADLAALAGR